MKIRIEAVGFMLFLMFLSAAAPVAAQDDPVAAIQKLYAQTQAAIRTAWKAEKEGSGAGLYATEIAVNSHNAPWRAVGNYSKKTTFWFTDQPEFAVNDNLPPEGVLTKIDVRVEAAVRRENEEYLFDRESWCSISTACSTGTSRPRRPGSISRTGSPSGFFRAPRS